MDLYLLNQLRLIQTYFRKKMKLSDICFFFCLVFYFLVFLQLFINTTLRRKTVGIVTSLGEILLIFLPVPLTYYQL